MNWRKSKKIIGLIIPTVIFLTGLGINSCSAPLTESPSITPLDSQISDSSPTATPSPTLPPNSHPDPQPHALFPDNHSLERQSPGSGHPLSPFFARFL